MSRTPRWSWFGILRGIRESMQRKSGGGRRPQPGRGPAGGRGAPSSGEGKPARSLWEALERGELPEQVTGRKVETASEPVPRTVPAPPVATEVREVYSSLEETMERGEERDAVREAEVLKASTRPMEGSVFETLDQEDLAPAGPNEGLRDSARGSRFLASKQRPSSTGARSGADAMSTTADWRTAIVLAEVLGPPVSLRGPHGSPSSPPGLR